MNPIKIALADDESLFRKGMALLINDFEQVELLLEAGDGHELLQKLSQAATLPDILLLDLKMPNLNGIETVKILSSEYPDIKVIILSTYFSRTFVVNLIELGVAAYLPKNSAPETVELTIKNVYEKEFYYSDEVMTHIRENMMDKKRQAKPSFFIQLTDREQEILQMICEQYTNTEIGEKLFISSRTVEGHRNNLLQKLNCRNTAGLVAFAIQHKLVQIDPSKFWR
ncbi:MAG: response regulator transcription factor [Bacteroidota bacterium]